MRHATTAAQRAMTMLIAGVLLSTCACSPMLRTHSEAALRRTESYVFIEDQQVPAVRGADGCGAQALAAAITMCEPELDAASLADELLWHDEGATPVEMLITARTYGRAARVQRGDWATLIERTRTNQPTLVMFDAAPEVRTMLIRFTPEHVMHWGIASGMARDESRILIGAAQERHHVIEREEFMRRWELADFCLIEIE